MKFMIKFFRGLSAYYKPEGAHKDGLYFTTDTFEILLNGQSYSGTIEQKEETGILNVEVVGNSLIVTFLNGETKVYPLNVYKSEIEDESLAMTTAYGDFKVGTTVGDLKGKSYNELFDGILFPTLEPTHTNPSVSGFNTSPSTSPVKLGTAVASITIPTLNKGYWKEYNNNASYAGAEESRDYIFNINGETLNNIEDLNNKVYNTLGDHTYTVIINYLAGEDPKNNKGAICEGKGCPEGFKSASKTINVTAPWYASTVISGELTEQALISWSSDLMTTPEFTLKPHTIETPNKFKTPRQVIGPKSLGRLQQYNSVAKAFENVDIADWEETTSTEQINGIDQTYYTYTYKGAARGETKLIVKF